MTIAEEKFLEIKDRYLLAYKKNNRKKVYKLWFEKGWVYLQTTQDYKASKYRITQFQNMCETLEARLK